ncbi:MAG: queuosine precursor transporter [Candidatus Nezhaarchaeales archaeon]
MDTAISLRDLRILIMLTGIFAASIVVANVAAAIKLLALPVGPLLFVVPAGTIAYAVTFPVTDIVDEVYGKKIALYVVWAGFAAEIAMLALGYADYWLPPLEPYMQEAYQQVFGLQWRIVLGSIVAYLISQHHDVWAFWEWKRITKGEWLWLRNNASTLVSQLIDSAVFIAIAFGGVYPIEVILDMILWMWIFKVMIALCDTPFVYLGVWLCKRPRQATQITSKEELDIEKREFEEIED